jgi:pimeloyl-ACP methyl ester carboxylesterase
MKRWEVIFAGAGAALLLIGAHWIRQAQLPSRTVILSDGGCHTPVTIIDPPAGVTPAGSVIVLHGLSANRRTMTYLGSDFAGHGLRSYLLDLPGHGDNRDAFSFARAQDCAAIAVESLVRAGTIDPKRTIVVGHSMGGAIAIRMADEEPVAATIAMSPGPSGLPRRMPANLLLFVAQFDLPPMQRQAQTIANAAGEDRTTPEDFAQQRAFRLRYVPHAAHTTWLLDRTTAHRSELWAMQTLFPESSAETQTLNLDLATYETFRQGRRRLAGSLVGIIGLTLLFPLCLAIAARVAGNARGETSDAFPARALTLVEGAACGLATTLILAAFIPLKFLHIYAGDYLASLMLIAGVLLLALNRKAVERSWSLDGRAIFAAAALGLAVILGAGAWVNWQLSDVWMNAPRWLRFGALVPVAWIFCYAEEVMAGPVGKGLSRALRFALVLALRLELWLACLLTYYALGSGQALIILLVATLAVFSILQRLATDALRVRAGPAAASLFGAILAAWFIAAVFPLT